MNTKNVEITMVGSGNSIDKVIVGPLPTKQNSENEGHQTGLCDRCQEEESAEHVVLVCRRYRAQREVMRNFKAVRDSRIHIKRIIKL